ARAAHPRHVRRDRDAGAARLHPELAVPARGGAGAGVAPREHRPGTIRKRGPVGPPEPGQSPTPRDRTTRLDYSRFPKLERAARGGTSVLHYLRSGLKPARSSSTKSSGSSQAAKWPPLSTSLKYVRLG